MIQQRYGFTDDYILSLPYARFMDMVETISKIKGEEIREKYRQAAFAAYLSGAGNSEEGGDTSFNGFLDKIGLNADSNVEDVTPQKVTKAEALAKAQQILTTFKWEE